MKKFSLYLITISFAMAACHSSKNTSGSNPGLKETYWKLTELMGKPVPTMESNKEMHMILKNEDNRIQGNAGCNTFTGSYELKEANRIAF
jgi:heat shock protein HslJ